MTERAEGVSPKELTTRKLEELSPADQARVIIATFDAPMYNKTILRLIPAKFKNLPEDRQQVILSDLEDSVWTPEKGWRKPPPVPPGVEVRTTTYREAMGQEAVMNTYYGKGADDYQKELFRIDRQQERAKQEFSEGDKLYWDLDPEKTFEQLGVDKDEVWMYVSKKFSPS